MFQQQEMMSQQQHINEMIMYQLQQRKLNEETLCIQRINIASNRNLTNNYQIRSLNLSQNKRQFKKDDKNVFFSLNYLP